VLPAGVEHYRALLPVGSAAGLSAYQQAVAGLTVRDLSEHYTAGLRWFHDEFAPYLRRVLCELSGGVWELDDFVAYAAGSDVDFMTHLVEAVAARAPVCLYPGDWFGFRVGVTQQHNIRWTEDSAGILACLCVPSVRNGHLTADMVRFLAGAPACLLNLNLYPTLPAAERQDVAQALAPVLERAVLSISFSRGFGLTASQLGVALVHRDHPYRQRFAEAWNWLTYFHNALAARAFLHLDIAQLQAVDEQRRRWVHDWLTAHGLPAVPSGSYYVKAFRPEGAIPAALTPLVRDGIARLCFKPPVQVA